MTNERRQEQEQEQEQEHEYRHQRNDECRAGLSAGRQVTRRGAISRALGLMATIAAITAISSPRSASAQSATTFPTRPITFVVPFPPAGPSDILARLVAQHMSKELGQLVIVDNKAGAAGAIGADFVARSEPDGYTLVLGGLPLEVLNPALYGPRLRYDPERQFRPVSVLAYVPYILVANPQLPANDVPQLVKLLKANPGKYNYGTPGAGNTSHISAEMFKKAAGVEITHVPYKGDAPAMQDLMGGQVQLVFTLPVSALPQIQGGRVKALGTAAAQRSSVLPDLPTFKEQGIEGVEAETWFSMLAPSATPPAVVARLNAAVNKVLQLPEVNARLAELGARPGGGTPAETEAFVAAERAKWTPLVKASGATAD